MFGSRYSQVLCFQWTWLRGLYLVWGGLPGWCRRGREGEAGPSPSRPVAHAKPAAVGRGRGGRRRSRWPESATPQAERVEPQRRLSVGCLTL